MLLQLPNFLFFASVLAIPSVTKPLPPFNVDRPAATPTYYQVPLPTKFLNQTSLVKIIGATSGSAALNKMVNKRIIISTDTTPVNCLDGSHTDQDVNSLFTYGGQNTTIYLCPNATLYLLLPIQFTAESQTLTTLGSPTDSTRAILKVMGPSQTAAIIGSCSTCSYSTLSYVQFDGSRPLLGQWTLYQSALVEMGGNAAGQKINFITAFEPRGWSAVHAVEGYQNICRSIRITNNLIGPSGNGVTLGNQQRRAKIATTAGQWADGISLACQQSYVAGNTIVDATDGGIVIFGAPGSIITNNTIVSNTRVLMGGINLVDTQPFSASFAGVVVSNNLLVAGSTMMKVGIAMGTLVWSSINSPSFRTFGGLIIGNTFTSRSTGYFGDGVAVAGMNSTTVVASKFINANFGGNISNNCIPNSVPSPGALVTAPSTTHNVSLAGKWASSSQIMFLICLAPTGPITFNYSS